MEIKILGAGCPKCRRLEQLARKAVAQVGAEVDIAHVSDPVEIASFGVLSTPGLVVDGEVMCSSRLPREEEIVAWIGS